MKHVRLIIGVMLTSALLGCQSNSVKACDLDMSSNAYMDGNNAKVGVILCHGRVKNPTWYVVDPLRKGIHKRLGYKTISIQLPTGKVGESLRENLEQLKL